MDKVYKIQHVPTGLFYQPIKGSRGKYKTHLSTRGKVYTAKWFPIGAELKRVNVSVAQIKKLNLQEIVKEARWGGGEHIMECRPEDWKLITYNLVELEV